MKETILQTTLAGLGLDEVESTTYLQLLASGSVTAGVLARQLNLPRPS